MIASRPQGVGEPFCRISRRRFCARGRVLSVSGEGKREGFMGSKATSGRVRSSRISLVVNAAFDLYVNICICEGKG